MGLNLTAPDSLCWCEMQSPSAAFVSDSPPPPPPPCPLAQTKATCTHPDSPVPDSEASQLVNEP